MEKRQKNVKNVSGSRRPLACLSIKSRSSAEQLASPTKHAGLRIKLFSITDNLPTGGRLVPPLPLWEQHLLVLSGFQATVSHAAQEVLAAFLNHCLCWGLYSMHRPLDGSHRAQMFLNKMRGSLRRLASSWGSMKFFKILMRSEITRGKYLKNREAATFCLSPPLSHFISSCHNYWLCAAVLHICSLITASVFS